MYGFVLSLVLLVYGIREGKGWEGRGWTQRVTGLS